MDIQHFKQLKQGPETLLMEAVCKWSSSFSSQENCWIACSLPVGAGMPDLVVATYHPEILGLTDKSNNVAGVLAYLKAFPSASASKIANSIGYSNKKTNEAIEILLSANAISCRSDKFSLKSRWSQILPKTLTVEAKVHDWKKALEQAARNSIFVHQSYVAFPERLCSRVVNESIFDRLSVGVMSIMECGSVKIEKPAPRTKPIAWYYYYSLALSLSRFTRCGHAVSSSDR